MVKRARERDSVKCNVVRHIETYKKASLITFLQCKTEKLYEIITNVQIVDRPFLRHV